MVISIWLLVGFNPVTGSVQSTPVDNAHEGFRQYKEKERKSQMKQTNNPQLSDEITQSTDSQNKIK